MQITTTISEIFDKIYEKNFDNSFEKVKEKLPDLCLNYMILNHSKKLTKSILLKIIENGLSIFMACGYTSEYIDNKKIENEYLKDIDKFLNIINDSEVRYSISILSENTKLIEMYKILGKVLLDNSTISSINLEYLDDYIQIFIKLVNQIYENNILFFIDDFTEYLENNKLEKK